MDPTKPFKSFRFEVRKQWEKTDSDVNDMVMILKKWVGSQKHLPEIPSDDMLEYFLINCKFSIEKTKTNIDMYYTVRSIIPEFFTNNNPKLEENKRSWHYTCFCPLPVLTDDLYRINVIEFFDVDLENFDVNKMIIQMINVHEVLVHEDFIMGYKAIVDFKHLKLGHVKYMTPSVLKKLAFYNEKVSKGRLKELHFVHVPGYAYNFLEVLKQFLKPKLRNRIFMHKSFDTVYKYLPKELLPVDCGGSGSSIKELIELWMKKLEHYGDRFDKLEKLRVKEELRPEPLKNSELLGYYGNFRKIDID